MLWNNARLTADPIIGPLQAELASRDLSFKVKTVPARAMLLDNRPVPARCRYRDAEVELEIAEDAKPHAVFHELYHLHRRYVLCLPQISAKPGQPEDIAHNIDLLHNLIDHLRVVPAEIAAYPGDAAPYWLDIHDADLTRFDAFEDPQMRRGNLLLAWISLSAIAPESAVAKRAWAMLQHRQLARAARLLAIAVAKAGDNASHIARALLTELRNPKAEQICLLRYDPETRRDRILPFQAN
ncbi:hypothetical protein FHW79_005352 [Azospirillum sp. OGB3]|uniref:hypothetical protein n=1 Tax=Azospirillum sp. OGB3 TaxID=2587012 RepID=UPI001605AD78|nr:hypothetical protein [Azospirillum sp. OGB3]MBB3267687.1 hypothetical protein [Azospirillum sp. OGB3]